MTDRNVVSVGLIKGRHPMPVDEYIFDSIEDVHDYKGMEKHIVAFLIDRVGIGRCSGPGLNQADYYTDVELFCGEADLVVYVSGLTPVVVELVGACLRNGIRLTLMNFDTATQTYLPQRV